jgi:hypothetical protein
MALNLPTHQELPYNKFMPSTHMRSHAAHGGSLFDRPVEQDGEDEEAGVPVYGSTDNAGAELKDEAYEENTNLSENTTTESLNTSGVPNEELRNDKFRKKDWLPGQNVFDAATQEQRRLRNQKKDPSVIEALSQDSQAVTQEELVMDSIFSVQRIRNVYDDPSGAETSVGDNPCLLVLRDFLVDL